MLLEQLGKFRLPDLAIIVDGSDPYSGDILPSASLLSLSADQCLERDMMIYHFLRERQIPQTWLLAGGYGPDVWKIHAEFLRQTIANH